MLTQEEIDELEFLENTDNMYLTEDTFNRLNELTSKRDSLANVDTIADLRERAKEQAKEIGQYGWGSALENAFPRTLGEGAKVFDEGDIVSLDRAKAIGSALVGVPLDLLSVAGRNLASIPELIQGDISGYNKSMKQIQGTPSKTGGLGALAEGAGTAIRDPYTFATLGTPTGTLTGNLPKMSKVLSKFSSASNLGNKPTLPVLKDILARGAIQAVPETGVQIGMKALDEGGEINPWDVGTSLVLNTLGLSLSPTGKNLADEASSQFYQQVSPNLTRTRKYPSELAGEQALREGILEKNFADVSGDNQATQILDRLKADRDRLGEEQENLAKTDLFNSEALGIPLQDRTTGENIYQKRLLEEFINEPSRDPSSLTNFQLLPSERDRYIKGFQDDATGNKLPVPMLREDLQSIARDLPSNRNVALDIREPMSKLFTEGGFDNVDSWYHPDLATPRQLLDARKKIDVAGESKGAFDTSIPELSTQGELYRKVRQMMAGDLETSINNLSNDDIVAYLKATGREKGLTDKDITDEIEKVRKFGQVQKDLFKSYILDDILSQRAPVINKNPKDLPKSRNIFNTKAETLLKGGIVGQPSAVFNKPAMGDLAGNQQLYNQGKTWGDASKLPIIPRLLGASYRATSIDDLLQTPESMKRKAEEVKKKLKK